MNGNTAKRTAKYYIFAPTNVNIKIMSEILTRIPKDLTSSPVLTEKKEWILGAASLAAGIGASLFGANKAKKAARRAQAENQYRTNAEKAWYDKNYNTDYLDTKAGQNLMRRAQEVQDEYIRKADGAAAVGGGRRREFGDARKGRTPRLPERCGCFLVVNEWSAACDRDGGDGIACFTEHAEADSFTFRPDGES